MELAQMAFNKVNPVIVLDHAIFTEFLFTLDSHAIFRQHPLNIAVVFLDVLCNIVDSLLINFPATVRINLATKHNIRLIEMIWQKR